MVSAGDERSDFESDAAVEFDGEEDGADGLVLVQSGAVVGSDRNGVSDDERRPDVDVVVALVGRLDDGTESDLLVPVDSEDVEAVVVDSDLVVRVVGGDGDLDAGGQEIGAGDVEDVHGGVLDDEFGLRRLQNRPNQEDREEDEEEEDENSGVDSPGQL